MKQTDGSAHGALIYDAEDKSGTLLLCIPEVALARVSHRRDCFASSERPVASNNETAKAPVQALAEYTLRRAIGNVEWLK